MGQKSGHLPPMEGAYASVCAEQQLWCAVLLQALTDATRPLPKGRFVNVKSFEVLSDRQWLVSGDRHFRHVCELAGIDPDHVHAAALKIRDDDWTRPDVMRQILVHGITKNGDERRAA